ncbi:MULTISPECIES: bacillithiol biosynthesis deacetylase BshB1 [Carboxydocella]|uniref:Bacillithiol biosynthesis deacetylase BshB1 n=2 Tax=Carboxydocella TaxID=178898 RepID=A0A1T4M3S4_9FIRM|nr:MULTISPECIES: bacillithiol biosynthesis deacetylase BshB1 [Carboxydocella]AVX21059.1 bacillithiol biosynthesis deacetylase BshB1 [Carboxydocella thermautotrophica]AVX31479.1 bacillithiol biosynthesis deacetylase BshB1 [Carboxydocella thermautotrophica]SJZ61571.1 bacillithiol biosynthesis deacetylase BshB1 [Carboxydocella sporoproducens DSM 16521]GAW28815.1 bacillithiol biosynthesis deacetylase BshB1 [Carboxydocella sp. ULO1]GAW32281.1 bacillithiol biosynthesis deacetylase BshB1 [Carboxydoce
MDIIYTRDREAALVEVEALVVGPHPDDAEIGSGGLMARWGKEGIKFGIADLTRGEQGTNGTVEERREESRRAAEILGATWRINLQLPDGGLALDPEQVAALVRLIRQVRPRLLLVPYWEDRHPDHRAASQLAERAHFEAGLRKVLPELEPYRPREIVYYFINRETDPSFIIDISEEYETKREAVLAHRSQFFRENRWLPTRLNGHFPYLIETRCRFWGAKIGAEFGEGFLVKNPLVLTDPLEIWR